MGPPRANSFNFTLWTTFNMILPLWRYIGGLTDSVSSFLLFSFHLKKVNFNKACAWIVSFYFILLQNNSIKLIYPKKLYQIVFLKMNDYRKGNVGLFLITFPHSKQWIAEPFVF